MQQIQPEPAGPLPAHKRKADLVYDYLREQILNGSIEPGRRLTLPDVARELALSHMPVREALLRLEREGLLETAPHKGMRVARLSVLDAWELFQVRATLEGLAARLACERDGPNLAGALHEINSRFKDAFKSGDYAEMAVQNWRFHAAILAAAGNGQLTRLLEDVWAKCFRFRLGYKLIPGRAGSTVEEHASIVAALRAGDVSGARMAAERHIHRAGEDLMRSFREESGT